MYKSKRVAEGGSATDGKILRDLFFIRTYKLNYSTRRI